MAAVPSRPGLSVPYKLLLCLAITRRISTIRLGTSPSLHTEPTNISHHTSLRRDHGRPPFQVLKLEGPGHGQVLMLRHCTADPRRTAQLDREALETDQVPPALDPSAVTNAISQTKAPLTDTLPRTRRPTAAPATDRRGEGDNNHRDRVPLRPRREPPRRGHPPSQSTPTHGRDRGSTLPRTTP